jgi:hypothetical protein
MKRYTGGLLLIVTMLLGILAEAALAQPRKIPFDFLPKQPSEMAPPPGIVGPTQNMTNVAQAIITRAKSLTTLVAVAPGVPVTQPITISILYLSPAGSERITQTYVPSTGNRFLYNDLEGDGKPRQMNMHITLTEPRAEGGVHTFTWSSSLVLDPLYDVKIGSLEFTLFVDCDLIGRSEITLLWNSPDRETHHVEFLTKAGDHIPIDGFAWSREEVSASENLLVPHVYSFYEHDFFDFLPFGFSHGEGHGLVPLVPGTTRQVVETLTERDEQCDASIQYTIAYELRFYPYL